MSKYIILVILLMVCSCGFESAFKPLDNSEFFSIKADADPRIIPLVEFAVQTWNLNYKVCPINIKIVPRMWGFSCGGILAAGCSYGEVIDIGIHHTSTCETIKVILHELYHSCYFVHTHTEDWQYPMQMLIYKLEAEGYCSNGAEELYDPYNFY